MQTYPEIPVGREVLAACLHRPPPGRLSVAAPVVVCCHGLTGTRVGACYRFVRLARRLEQENIACLRFDFRGCGESDGRFEDVTVARLVEDLRAAVAWLDHAPGCDPSRVGIAASSFGALATSLAAAEFGSLRCAVFWAPVADAWTLVDREMTPSAWELVRAQGWIDHRGLRMGRAFLDTLPRDNAPEILAARRTPLLIYHGRGDAQVGISHGRAYEAAMRSAGGEVRLEEIPMDDHGMRAVSANDRIIDGSVGWFRRFLHPEAPA
ncbi:MAG: alpha/beta hydrolase family protein [Phycisphaerae bacterium]